MAQYVEVEEAIGMSGLRVVLTPSVPGPWTEAAKAILRVKNLPYVKVRRSPVRSSPSRSPRGDQDERRSRKFRTASR